MLHETSRNDVTWGEFYIRAFLPTISLSTLTATTTTKLQRKQTILSVIPRTIADTNLSVYQLFSRKAQRRLFKAVPLVIELDLNEPSFSVNTYNNFSSQLEIETSTSVTITKSRRESIDIQTLPGPEQLAAAEASFIGVGAMRFVHLSKHGIVLGCTDQGHLAAWNIETIKQQKIQTLQQSKKEMNSYSIIQSDIFAHAIGAKARRDAKRKYLGRNSQKENRLVYFKIKAMNKKNKNLLLHQTIQNNSSIGKDNNAILKAFDTDDDFDIWGNSTTDTNDFRSIESIKGNSIVSGISSRTSSIGESALRHESEINKINNITTFSSQGGRFHSCSLDDGESSESTTNTTATLPRHQTDNSSDNENTESIYSSEYINQQNISHGHIDNSEFNDQTSLIHPLDAWEAPEKDNRRHIRKKSNSTNPDGSSDEDNLENSNGGNISRSNSKSKRKVSDASDKKRGKELWSPEDRAKYDEKQAKWANKQQLKIQNEKEKKLLQSTRNTSQPSSPRSEPASNTLPSRSSSNYQSISPTPEYRLSSPFGEGNNYHPSRERSNSQHSQGKTKHGKKKRDSLPTLSLPSIPSADQLAEALSQQALQYRLDQQQQKQNQQLAVPDDTSIALNFDAPILSTLESNTTNILPSRTTTNKSNASSDYDSELDINDDELVLSLGTSAFRSIGDPNDSPNEKPTSLGRKLEKKLRAKERRAEREAIKIAKRRGEPVSPRSLPLTSETNNITPMKSKSPLLSSTKYIPTSPPLPSRSMSSGKSTGLGVAIGKEPRSPPLLTIATGITESMDNMSLSTIPRTVSTPSNRSTGNTISDNGLDNKVSITTVGDRHSPDSSRVSSINSSRNTSPKLSAIKPSSPVAHKPKGSQLRSDIWVTCHWIRHEIPIARQRKLDNENESRTNSITVTNSNQSIDLSMPDMEPRPLGSGEAVTYHALLAFGDGSLGVVVPQSISLRPNDVVVIGSNTSDVTNTSSHNPTIESALYLNGARTRTPSFSGSSNTSTIPYIDDSSRWLNRGMTWLERPTGEEKERIAAATVCKGRHFIRSIPSTVISPSSSSFPSHLTNVGSTRDKFDIVSTSYNILTDIEHDIIIAAFGRVVGIWLYMDRSSRKDRVSTSSTNNEENNDREGAKSPGGSFSSSSKKALRKQQQLLEGGEHENVNNNGINPSRTVSGTSITSQNTYNTDTTFTDNLDYSIQPYTIFRGHANVITCVNCWRKRIHTGIIAPSYTPASYGGTEGLTYLETGIVAVVSGDAQGEICLFHIHEPSAIISTAFNGNRDTSNITRIATLQISGRKGTKEGVSCIAIDSDFIVAGGSEGTVAAWRRKFLRTPSSSNSLQQETEMVPDLLFRENRAHSIVRVVQVPGGRTQVSAILSGGGEGDVRLWPIPVLSPTSTSVITTVSSNASSSILKSINTVNNSVSATPLSMSSSSSTSVNNVIVKECRLLKGHQSRISGLYFNTTICITTSLDGTIKIWDLQAPHLGRLLHSSRVPNNEEISSLHCIGTDILVGTVEGHIFTLSFGTIKGNNINSNKENNGQYYQNNHRSDTNNNYTVGIFNSETRMRDIRTIINQ